MMKSQESTDDTRKLAVKEAQAALRANLSADFKDLTPHLRLLLENLPILQPSAPILQAYPADKAAAESNAEGTMDFLRRGWIKTKATEYEMIGLASIADEPELLSLTFRGNIWSVGYMEQHLTVARVAEDKFRCWRYHESGGIWGTAPGEYETPSPS
jgi:hypothetical protein